MLEYFQINVLRGPSVWGLLTVYLVHVYYMILISKRLIDGHVVLKEIKFPHPLPNNRIYIFLLKDTRIDCKLEILEYEKD